ncbi:MAG: zinc-binding dehydrogenase [Spirochaetaceae bacterium]
MQAVNYFTAYLVVYHFGNLQDGERVLIHNAGGGVGVAALELARLRDCTIFATASAGKHEFLRNIGADHPIDYRNEEVARAVRQTGAGDGVHLVLDPLGGTSLKRDYELLAPLGRIVAYGASVVVGGRRRSVFRALRVLFRMPRFSPIRLMNDNAAVMGLNLGHLWGELMRLRRVGERILSLAAEGRIRPRAAHTFDFDRVRAAHRFIHERRNTGKVVLLTGGGGHEAATR